MSRAIGFHLWCGNPVGLVSEEWEIIGARFACWHDLLPSRVKDYQGFDYDSWPKFFLLEAQMTPWLGWYWCWLNDPYERWSTDSQFVPGAILYVNMDQVMLPCTDGKAKQLHQPRWKSPAFLLVSPRTGHLFNFHHTYFVSKFSYLPIKRS